MAWKKGERLPRHRVTCLTCGASVLRASHWRRPHCDDCNRKRGNRAKNHEVIKYRREARRYRIILHVLGWEDDQFEEMLIEMKRSPMMFRKKPETRVAKLDLHFERRASG